MFDLWIKAVIRFPANIGRARRLLSSEQSAEQVSVNGRPVVLDLRTPQMLFDSGRHLTCLVHNARLAGSPTILRCNRLLLAEIARKQFGEATLTDPNVTWLPPAGPLPDDGLVLYDSATPRADVSPTGSARMMIGRDIVGGTPVMPYPMHPATLSLLDQVDIASLRDSPRQFQLLFAGTQTARYGYPRVERDFGVQSRMSLIETVRRLRSSRVLPSPDGVDHRDSIVLVDSQTHSIHCMDWLPALAKADFFLCCPGAAQPMCHNVIEAMSVGTIPLIEYGDRFSPALRDGENAICFRGLDGLAEALDRIDSLTADQVGRMRHSVIEYYDQHLRSDRFLTRTDLAGGMISMPFNDKNFFDADQRSGRAA